MTRIFAIAVTAILGITVWVQDAQAEGRQRLGYGLLFTNDVLGDTQDRWRSGSVTSSRVWGPVWQGHAPERFGQMLEFRFHGEVISPENLTRPAANDRPYAGNLGFGLHTHFERARIEYALGADLIVTGSQTGLDDFQDFLHGFLGGRDVGRAVRRNQIDNDIRPSAVFEAARAYELGSTRIRPFAEARLGVEDLIRAGADIMIGGIGVGELLVRDSVTGHRYRVVRADRAGTTFLLGGDIAYVDDSDYLPASSGVTLSEDRTRLRAGLHWENRKGAALFYGLTWLGEEFEEQREGQFLGSVQFRLRF
ncbi:lipid A-modifier LpxR family protein [uncultured Roseovarius sp.]|uniref:lipid A-modifier LpxR family protein n=1 Tax=uncultured Roseovarius sp. TaxID=293344 RepID=UPI00261F2CF8|nr:lipid A-modifier LpxR family protein [uncultured Roseovarius sp.]